MNRKGQVGGFVVFAIFIGVILVFALIPQIFSNQSQVSTVQFANNSSFVLPAQDTEVDLSPCQQANTSAILLWNATNDLVYPAANYTVSQKIGDNGYPSARINLTGTYASKDWEGTTATVQCDYQAFGYNTDSGSRSIAGLWGIFVALAIAIFVFAGIKFEWF